MSATDPFTRRNNATFIALSSRAPERSKARTHQVRQDVGSRAAAKGGANGRGNIATRGITRPKLLQSAIIYSLLARRVDSVGFAWLHNAGIRVLNIADCDNDLKARQTQDSKGTSQSYIEFLCRKPPVHERIVEWVHGGAVPTPGTERNHFTRGANRWLM